MRIGIDGRELQGRATGAGRYLRNLLRAWNKQDQLFVYFRGSAPPDPLLARWGVTLRPIGARRDRGLLWQERLLPEAARTDRLDVFFAPAYFCPLSLDVPRVTAIHDMSFYSAPHDFTPWDGIRRRLLVRLSALASRRILTISDFSRREIATHLPAVAGRIRTTLLAADADLPPPPPREEARRALGLEGPSLLSVGSILNRRCLPVLLAAVRGLVRAWPDLRLDLVGDNRTHPRLDLDEMLRDLDLTRNVRVSGFVSDAELAARYAAADVVVYLSEYEGFGLPVLEALSRGLPVVTTRRPATGQIFEGAALLTEPDDPREIGEQLRFFLSDPAARAAWGHRGRIFAAAFSWEKTATETRAVLAEAVSPLTDPSPAVSVVVVSYNTRELLLACLASLAPVTLPLQLIVVDNDSADGSAEAVRTQVPHATVIANRENVGFSKANNAGLRVAHAPYVLVLNSDAAVRAGAVEALAVILDRNPAIGIVGPRTVSANGVVQLSFGPDLTPWNEWRQRRLVRGLARGDRAALRQAERLASEEHPVPWVSGSCLLARRDLLERIGGFDEGFFLYEEDVDLCVRARAAGFKVLFTPRAEVVHHLGRSMETARERAKQAYRESHRRFYEKHNGPLDRALLRLWMLFR